MLMKSDFPASTTDAIVSEIQIAAPPERIFQALTDPAQLALWFGNVGCPVKQWEMDPRPGGRYGYSMENGTLTINGVSKFECHGEITEIDPPHLLVYTWVANWHDDKSHRTVVRWELFSEDNGTRVRVTHSGLAGEDVARKDYTQGWPGVLQQLKKFMED
jgi:uncharacterized protein YndB with AHSA1/START domain